MPDSSDPAPPKTEEIEEQEVRTEISLEEYHEHADQFLDNLILKLEQRQEDKADLDALGMLCTEIKEKISELNLPDPEALPSKADVEQITGLINDFRESHDKVREGYENDIAITAKQS